MGSVDDLPLSSKQVLNSLADRLRDRFPKTTIETGKMAVTIGYSDGSEIQLLPAYRNGQRFEIPDPNSPHWIQSNPTAFTRRLTGVNKANNGRVIPVIKLMKRLCEKRGIELKSYHIENLALNAFDRYSDAKTYPAMLCRLLNYAKGNISRRLPDPSGQSDNIGASLSGSQQKMISRQLKQVEDEIRGALESDSTEKWKYLFKR